MANKTFGQHAQSIIVKTDEDFLNDLRKIVDVDFPAQLSVVNGELVGFSYETKWKSGTTKSIEKKDGSIEYKPVYEDKSLTKEQIEKIDNWARQNVISQE